MKLSKLAEYIKENSLEEKGIVLYHLLGYFKLENQQNDEK